MDNNKNLVFFSQDFIDAALEASQLVWKTEKHNSVLEMAISSFKCRLVFVTLLDSHLMIGTGKILLGKLFCMTQSIEKSIDK